MIPLIRRILLASKMGDLCHFDMLPQHMDAAPEIAEQKCNSSPVEERGGGGCMTNILYHVVKIDEMMLNTDLNIAFV